MVNKMFEENKNWFEYCKDEKIETQTVFGTPAEVEMQDAIYSMFNDINDNGKAIKFIKAFDAVHEDIDVTEALAKHFVGSWLQVVKSFTKDDKEWFDETVKFMRDAADWVEGKNDD